MPMVELLRKIKNLGCCYKFNLLLTGGWRWSRVSKRTQWIVRLIFGFPIKSLTSLSLRFLKRRLMFTKNFGPRMKVVKFTWHPKKSTMASRSKIMMHVWSPKLWSSRNQVLLLDLSQFWSLFVQETYSKKQLQVL